METVTIRRLSQLASLVPRKADQVIDRNTLEFEPLNELKEYEAEFCRCDNHDTKWPHAIRGSKLPGLAHQ